MTDAAPKDMPEETKALAAQVGQVMASVQRYLQTLGNPSQELAHASKDIETATFWMTRHVLRFGPPPKPPAANDAAAPPAEDATLQKQAAIDSGALPPEELPHGASL
jgi:hypothetical protein